MHLLIEQNHNPLFLFLPPSLPSMADSQIVHSTGIQGGIGSGRQQATTTTKGGGGKGNHLASNIRTDTAIEFDGLTKAGRGGK